MDEQVNVAGAVEGWRLAAGMASTVGDPSGACTQMWDGASSEERYAAATVLAAAVQQTFEYLGIPMGDLPAAFESEVAEFRRNIAGETD